jgi:hypothetical protein
MADPKAPYFVHFSADPASSARIDHSQAILGGDPTKVGLTAIDFLAGNIGSPGGRGGLTWQKVTGSPRVDGSIPFWFSSVNVYFRLTDYVVQITSDYAERSCVYNATFRHEVNEHILTPTRIMYSFRDPFVMALNALPPLPTKAAPRWIQPNKVAIFERGYINLVGGVVTDFRRKVSDALQQARAASDSDASYKWEKRQCPIKEWDVRESHPARRSRQ